MRLAGYGGAGSREDPFSGFRGAYRVFSRKTLEDGGDYWVLNPNKRRYFRTRPFPAEKRPGVYRIFCFGGSSTWGQHVAYELAYPALLERGLSYAYPARRFEVVNAGAVAYGSHRVRLVLEEACLYEPDLFIVYSGHNEYLEPGFYREILERSRPVVELQGRLNRLRLYVLLRSWLLLLKPVRHPDDRPAEERLAELGVAADKVEIERDATLFTAVPEKFRQNLSAMVRKGHKFGVPLVLCTVPANATTEPEASLFSRPMSPVERTRWDETLQAAEADLDAKKYDAARSKLDELKKIDSRHARARWLMGRALEGLGRPDEARVEYEAARDLDAWPKRSPPAFEKIVGEVAARRGAVLADVARAFRDAPDGGLLQRNLFIDNCHPNIIGHQVISRTIIGALKDSGLVGK